MCRPGYRGSSAHEDLHRVRRSPLTAGLPHGYLHPLLVEDTTPPSEAPTL